MMDKRGVKAVICSRYISAFINVSKVPLTSFQNRDVDVSESVESLRVIQRQLERLEKRCRVDELARKPLERKVVYAELLDLCRELKWEFTEATGAAKAKTCLLLPIVALLYAYCCFIAQLIPVE